MRYASVNKFGGGKGKNGGETRFLASDKKSPFVDLKKPVFFRSLAGTREIVFVAKQ